ncbi:ribosome silencing factor [Thalassoroseus pseudoceratinae]|uniref:ribosome silencing factor n=1 Tax=Thalassoroseus pseudoceratinae TaxID=2713176 RepID=UPI001F0E89EB|nr:ribosome silencing factor [Thalassoroseus pseudoceratinae]
MIEQVQTQRTAEQQQSLIQACRCARICEDLRGRDTLVLEMIGITPIFDYFVITTGTNRRQMHALSDEVSKLQRTSGTAKRGSEGYDESTWIVQDYGDIILHVFTEESREMYDLESLWADAKRIDWQSVLEESSSENCAVE